MAKNKTQTTAPVAKTDEATLIIETLAKIKAQREKEAQEKARNDEMKAKRAEVEALIERNKDSIPADMIDALREQLLPNSTKSGIMDRKYYKKYSAQGGNNGDRLAVGLRGGFMFKDDNGNEHFDRPKFVSWAKEHSLWVETYSNLNVGQVRMNVGNRARAKLKNGGVVKINGVEYTKADIAK